MSRDDICSTDNTEMRRLERAAFEAGRRAGAAEMRERAAEVVSGDITLLGMSAADESIVEGVQTLVAAAIRGLALPEPPR